MADLKKLIIEEAMKCDADIVKFAPIERFGADSDILKLYPEAKTVIGLAFRVLRGSLRGVAEGTTYYQYSTMGVECLEETVMPRAMLRVSNVLEEAGFGALPQRRHQRIMNGSDDTTNPEVAYENIYFNVEHELKLNFEETAYLCGLGELSFKGTLLTPEFGPLQRYCFVITDAEIEPDEMCKANLCDNCGKCVNACPGKAIDENGKTDTWQCTVYYNGANGTKNPFMPANAYEEFENRLEIIAGECKVDKELAKKILKRTIFYPPIKHMYRSSICGRACDMACYAHLEESGKLTRSFNTPFVKREDWKFDIKDFEIKEESDNA